MGFLDKEFEKLLPLEDVPETVEKLVKFELLTKDYNPGRNIPLLSFENIVILRDFMIDIIGDIIKKRKIERGES